MISGLCAFLFFSVYEVSMWHGHACCLTQPSPGCHYFPSEQLGLSEAWVSSRVSNTENPLSHLIFVSWSLEINCSPNVPSCPDVLCDKMFPSLSLHKQSGHSFPFFFFFQYRPSWITAIWYHGNSKGKARPGIVEERPLKALNQSALMDDLCRACICGLV